jgi:chaperonin GroES
MKNTDKKMKIFPLADRVLIKQADEKDQNEKNKFGIIIPDTVNKEKSEQGEVVALGTGKKDENGKDVPFNVKVGDTVIFSKYGYDEVTIDGQEYVMVKEENILAIIK